MDELREGDVGSSARDEAHSHHHSKSAHGLVAVALLAATGPWVLFGDEVVGQTVREITMAGAALAAHSAVALCLLAWAIQPHRVRKYDYWLVTAMTTLVRSGTCVQSPSTATAPSRPRRRSSSPSCARSTSTTSRGTSSSSPARSSGSRRSTSRLSMLRHCCPRKRGERGARTLCTVAV